MSTIELVELIEKLPLDKQKEVEGYINKLSAEIEANATAQSSGNDQKKLKREFGGLKGFIKYIADDFDEPMELISTSAIKKLERLSSKSQNQIEQEIELLFDKENKTPLEEKSKPRATFGQLKGVIKYIADDFDEPLEEFKDYM